MTYHPDRNPAGAEMMKVINAAYDILTGSAHHVAQTAGFPVQVNHEADAFVALRRAREP